MVCSRSLQGILPNKTTDTEGSPSSADPLAALEKSTDALNHLTHVQKPRLESLKGLSDSYGNDPYSRSMVVRRHFRAQRNADAAERAADDQIKQRYGLSDALKLLPDNDETRQEASKEWANCSTRRARLSASNGPYPGSVVSSLRCKVLRSTHQARGVK